MRVLFLNQYGEGDSSPTARLVAELAEELRRSGTEVHVSGAGSYGARASGRRRWLGELKAHTRLFWQALIVPRPDVIVSLTSPACLLLPALFVAKLRGARSVHWAMDLYPDIALALGEIRPGPLFRLLRYAMRFAYWNCDAVVVLDEDMRDHLQRHYQIRPRVIPLWPSAEFLRQMTEPVPPPDEDRWIWLYSGNLGQAHDWRTMLEAQAILEARGLPIWLAIQGDGRGFREAQAFANQHGLVHCLFRSYVPREDVVSSLLSARAWVATRKPEAAGLLWPSKLVLLRILPRPLAWIDSPHSAVSRDLAKRNATKIFVPGEAKALADWLETCFHQPSEIRTFPADQREMRTNILGEWKKLLERA